MQKIKALTQGQNNVKVKKPKVNMIVLIILEIDCFNPLSVIL